MSAAAARGKHARRWRRKHDLGDQRGIALIAVLWVTTILALIAAVFMRETRVEVNLRHNSIENAKAEALADAGVNRAILGLLGLDKSLPWAVDGTPYEFAFADGTVTVAMQDEGGKIDLNRSAGSVLQGLFTSVGVAPASAERLADAIADFRDADNLRRPNGAEDADYAAANLPYDAKDAPFATTEELLQVLGMTRALYDRVAPLITVYSPRRDVNLATAPPEVLRALPYLTPDHINALLQQRTTAGAAARRFRVMAVTVLSAARTANGGTFIREAVLRRGSDASMPFQTVEWRRRWPQEGVAAASQ
jgi:general secretion pathway protein K